MSTNRKNAFLFHSTGYVCSHKTTSAMHVLQTSNKNNIQFLRQTELTLTTQPEYFWPTLCVDAFCCIPTLTAPRHLHLSCANLFIFTYIKPPASKVSFFLNELWPSKKSPVSQDMTNPLSPLCCPIQEILFSSTPVSISLPDILVHPVLFKTSCSLNRFLPWHLRKLKVLVNLVNGVNCY